MPGDTTGVRVGNVYVTFSADASQYIRGTQQAAAANRGFGRSLDQFAASFRTAIIASAAYAASIGGISLLFGGSVRAATEFEDRLVAVGKTAGLTDSELERLGQNMTELTTRASALGGALPVARSELLQIAEVAGQMNIRGVRDITAFTEAVGLMTLTTDLAGESAANALGIIIANTSATAQDALRIASVTTALGNAFRGGERDILTTANEIARSTAAFQLAADDILSVSAVLAASGVRFEQAGTVIQRTLSALQDTVSLASTGDFTRLEVILDPLVGDAVQLQTEMNRFLGLLREGTEASRFEGLLTVVRALREAGPGGQANILTTLFGGETPPVRIQNVLGVLASNLDEIDRAANLANQEMLVQAAILEEAGRFAEAYSARLQVVRNELLQQSTVIGGAIIPAFTALAENFRFLEAAGIAGLTSFAAVRTTRAFAESQRAARSESEQAARAYNRQRESIRRLEAQQQRSRIVRRGVLEGLKEERVLRAALAAQVREQAAAQAANVVASTRAAAVRPGFGPAFGAVGGFREVNRTAREAERANARVARSERRLAAIQQERAAAFRSINVSQGRNVSAQEALARARQREAAQLQTLNMQRAEANRLQAIATRNNTVLGRSARLLGRAYNALGGALGLITFGLSALTAAFFLFRDNSVNAMEEVRDAARGVLDELDLADAQQGLSTGGVQLTALEEYADQLRDTLQEIDELSEGSAVPSPLRARERALDERRLEALDELERVQSRIDQLRAGAPRPVSEEIERQVLILEEEQERVDAAIDRVQQRLQVLRQTTSPVAEALTVFEPRTIRREQAEGELTDLELQQSRVAGRLAELRGRLASAQDEETAAIERARNTFIRFNPAVETAGRSVQAFVAQLVRASREGSRAAIGEGFVGDTSLFATEYRELEQAARQALRTERARTSQRVRDLNAELAALRRVREEAATFIEPGFFPAGSEEREQAERQVQQLDRQILQAEKRLEVARATNAVAQDQLRFEGEIADEIERQARLQTRARIERVLSGRQRPVGLDIDTERAALRARQEQVEANVRVAASERAVTQEIEIRRAGTEAEAAALRARFEVQNRFTDQLASADREGVRLRAQRARVTELLAEAETELSESIQTAGPELVARVERLQQQSTELERSVATNTAYTEALRQQSEAVETLADREAEAARTRVQARRADEVAGLLQEPVRAAQPDVFGAQRGVLLALANAQEDLGRAERELEEDRVRRAGLSEAREAAEIARLGVRNRLIEEQAGAERLILFAQRDLARAALEYAEANRELAAAGADATDAQVERLERAREEIAIAQENIAVSQATTAALDEQNEAYETLAERIAAAAAARVTEARAARVEEALRTPVREAFPSGVNIREEFRGVDPRLATVQRRAGEEIFELQDRLAEGERALTQQILLRQAASDAETAGLQVRFVAQEEAIRRRLVVERDLAAAQEDSRRAFAEYTDAYDAVAVAGDRASDDLLDRLDAAREEVTRTREAVVVRQTAVESYDRQSDAVQRLIDLLAALAVAQERADRASRVSDALSAPIRDLDPDITGAQRQAGEGVLRLQDQIAAGERELTQIAAVRQAASEEEAAGIQARFQAQEQVVRAQIDVARRLATAREDEQRVFVDYVEAYDAVSAAGDRASDDQIARLENAREQVAVSREVVAAIQAEVAALNQEGDATEGLIARLAALAVARARANRITRIEELRDTEAQPQTADLFEARRRAQETILSLTDRQVIRERELAQAEMARTAGSLRAQSELLAGYEIRNLQTDTVQEAERQLARTVEERARTEVRLARVTAESRAAQVAGNLDLAEARAQEASSLRTVLVNLQVSEEEVEEYLEAVQALGPAFAVAAERAMDLARIEYQSPLDRLADDAQSFADRLESATASGLERLGSSLANVFDEGELSLREFGQSIVTELLNAFVQVEITQPLARLFQSGFGEGGFLSGLLGNLPVGPQALPGGEETAAAGVTATAITTAGTASAAAITTAGTAAGTGLTAAGTTSATAITAAGTATGTGLSTAGAAVAAAITTAGSAAATAIAASATASSAGGLLSGIFHSGGVADDPAPVRRSLNAPLRSDEMMAVLQRGEMVIPRGLSQRLRGRGSRMDWEELRAWMSRLPRFHEGGVAGGVGGGGSSSGSAAGQDIRVRIDNRGTPQQVTSAQARSTPEGLLLSIITEDGRRNGPLARTTRAIVAGRL